MKQLTCEMCGNTDLTKRDGVFVCQSCGCKYSAEEAKKMMVEGTVDVSGSTVKVDDTSKLDNYLEIAKGAIMSNNYSETEQYCNKALEVDPRVANAWFLKSRSVLLQSTLNNPKRIGEAMGYFVKGLACIPKEEYKDHPVETFTDTSAAAALAMFDLGKISRFLIKQGTENHEREASHKSAELYTIVLAEIENFALPVLLEISSKERFPEMMRRSARAVLSNMTLNVLFDEKERNSRLITPKVQIRLADEERNCIRREGAQYSSKHRWLIRHMDNLILFNQLIEFLKKANPEGLATLKPRSESLVLAVALKFHIENFPFDPASQPRGDGTFDLPLTRSAFYDLRAETRSRIMKLKDEWTLELKILDPSYEPKKPEPTGTEANTTTNASSTANGGCYVATAVYGSYDCPQVWTLRRYRDYILAETRYGRAFIRVYYAISPTLVKWFGHTEWFKKMWKGKLDRMVANLNSEGVVDTPYEDRIW